MIDATVIGAGPAGLAAAACLARRGEPFDAVVLATGYRPRLDEFLDAPDGAQDGHGWPPGLESPPLPALYFLGLRPSPIGMLHQISLDARRIAARVAALLQD